MIRAARSLGEVPPALKTASPGTTLALDAVEIVGSDGRQWSPPWNRLLATRAGDGILLTALVQPAGRRVMHVSEFLRGHPISQVTHFKLPETSPHSLF